MNAPLLRELEKNRSAPPMVSGRLPLLGHGLELLRDPHKLIRRGYEEHGLIFSIDMGLSRGRIKALFPEGHGY